MNPEDSETKAKEPTNEPEASGRRLLLRLYDCTMLEKSKNAMGPNA
jgi:hypothetical protein